MANTASVDRSGDVERSITQALESADLFLAVEVVGSSVQITGEVDSEADRGAALDVASAVARPLGLTIDDNIEVLEMVGLQADGAYEGTALPETDLPVAIDELDALTGDASDPDDLGSSTSDLTRVDPAASTMNAVGTVDPGEAGDEAVPYFPPTDPVVRPTSDAEELAIVGGFSATSMDGDDDMAPQPGDDDGLARLVRRELRQDAATIDLLVDVAVEDGVVALTGLVQSLDDAENAEAVAARVPGVLEVVEEITVAGLLR
ncbi:MAG: BON domain-containing protein [Thermomicrobiales bacterium]